MSARCYYSSAVSLSRVFKFMKPSMFFYVLIGLLFFKSPLILAQGSSQYRLSSGDVIRIDVVGEQDLSFNDLRLTDAGSFTYPFIGDLNAQGKTAAQIEQLIADKLRGDYLVDPRVSVSVPRYRQFFISGEVRSPGVYPYQAGLTLRRAVALAGGLTKRGSESRMTIGRDQGSVTQTHKGSFDSPLLPGNAVTIARGVF